MLKTPEKHWDFAKCAGLRMVISLSSMRARAWETTKIPPATLRTRLILQSSATKISSPVRSQNLSFRTRDFLPQPLGIRPPVEAPPL